MALPFLNNKKNEAGIASAIIKNRTPDVKPQDDSDADGEYSLEDCAHDILESIRANDAAGLADALKEAFQKLEQEPHEEGEHIEPHSYEAQNQKAGQE